MKKDLLICIAFHYSKDRIKYLMFNLVKLLNYENKPDIFIDTNAGDLLKTNSFLKSDRVTVFVHENLSHPFHLTIKHRQQFKENIDNYENFLYVEDDMLLTYENYLSFMDKFKMMWSKFIPSFVRIEKANGNEYVTDVINQFKINESDIVVIDGRKFISFKFPQNYNALWLMPGKELKESITEDFTTLHDSREKAASYPMWELNKTPLVEIEKIDGKYQIKKDCYAYHLPNNYALCKESPNAKIKVQEIFI